MSNIGYVAIDDLELEAFEGDCSYEPPSAKPTTTPATTTTPETTTPQPNKGSCNFQEDTCGWEVSAKNAEFFGSDKEGELTYKVFSKKANPLVRGMTAIRLDISMIIIAV